MVKPKFPETNITPDHPDFAVLSKVREAIFSKMGGAERLSEQLPTIIKNAVDFVLDPERTLRTEMSQLDKVEKTFIGLKIEHYLRDLIGCPKGSKRDAKIADIEIDIKNTIGSTWMIPRETYRHEEPCILIATAKFDGRCWLGLVLARTAYLNAENQDKKRSISEEGRRNIMWLVRDAPYPPSRWHGINMERFKELRNDKKLRGNKRVAQFFSENLGLIVDRSVLEVLANQKDPMRRARSDKRSSSGTRELLAKDRIKLLCGDHPGDREIARNAGLREILTGEWVAVRSME